MLRNLKELTGYVLAARDGEIGRCHDFLFDDEHLAVRYMVADTGKWLSDRKVLISPAALGRAFWATRRFEVDLDRNQIKGSPPLDARTPVVSRQYERQWHTYYGWPVYWGGPHVWGTGMLPADLRAAAKTSARSEALENTDAEHRLRSMREVIGYEIGANDGEVGQVKDFVVDDASWRLQYLVVDTRKWLPGGHVIFSIDWLKGLDWAKRRVEVSLTIDQIKNAPHFDAGAPVNEQLEVRAYDYLGRPHPNADQQRRTP